MNEKNKNICKYLNFVILTSAGSGCVSISAFGSLVCVSVGIASSLVGLKVCAITAVIKKYESLIKEKKKKHDEIVLLGKTKLNIIEVIIFKFLIDFCISYEELLPVTNKLREYYEMKEEIKNSVKQTA